MGEVEAFCQTPLGTPSSSMSAKDEVSGVNASHTIQARKRDLGIAGLIAMGQAVLCLVGWSLLDETAQRAQMLALGIAAIGLTMVLSWFLSRFHRVALEKQTVELLNLRSENALLLNSGHRSILVGITKLAELRDPATGLHAERVCRITGMLADEWNRKFGGLSSDWISDLRLAASMHDIGKVSIPDSILLKPGKLTPSEYEAMQLHTEFGVQALHAVRDLLVGSTPLLDMAIDIAGAHHEHWEGGGYPCGQVGEQIPLAARIVAVADVFDALMSSRTYKSPMALDQVVEIIQGESGRHFDPRVVQCFGALIEPSGAMRSKLEALERAPTLLPDQQRTASEPRSRAQTG